MTSALERLREVARPQLLIEDFVTGPISKEPSLQGDLALLLAVADAARFWASNPDALDDALAAINTQDTTP